MTMQLSDKLLARSRGNVEDAARYYRDRPIKRAEEVLRYIRATFQYAQDAGIDPSIAIAQADLETDSFTSYWWNERLNPAGIGITGDPAQNAKSTTFVSGIHAARAQIAHLKLYASGTVDPFEPNDDPRYQAYVGAYGNKPVATTLNDLTNKWAIDAKYGEKIIARGNRIFPNLDLSPEPDEPTLDVAPIKVSGNLWKGLTSVRINGILFRGQRRTVHVNVQTLNLRKYADTKSPIVREAHYGEAIDVIGWVNSEIVGTEGRWWIGEDYTRIWVGGTSEKPS